MWSGQQISLGKSFPNTVGTHTCSMSSMIKTKVDQQKFEKDLRHKQMIDCTQQGEICLWNFQSLPQKTSLPKKHQSSEQSLRPG